MINRTFKFRFGNKDDLNALHENYVWFADFESLNDPFEGQVQFITDDINDELRLKFLTKCFSERPLKEASPEAEADSYYREYEEVKGIPFSQFVDSWAKKEFEKIQKSHRSRYFVFSQSQTGDDHEFPSPLNNIQMWSHYANKFEGYCIEFDFDRLKDTIQSMNSIMLNAAPVKYPQVGTLPTLNLKTFMQDYLNGDKEAAKEILKALYVKQQNWMIENEVRFISQNRGKHYYDPSSIRAIYIAEKMPSTDREEIISTVEAKRKGIKIFDVEIHEDEYMLGFSPR
ncbi:DUF2971 domain-containing protein [Microbulbifer sp. ANSA002]|uniref:DUF2971 domain-containing protein n=1 Tax=unclassified Microbulbifer TaxID=2619833 RepID=UPI00404390FD